MGLDFLERQSNHLDYEFSKKIMAKICLHTEPCKDYDCNGIMKWNRSSEQERNVFCCDKCRAEWRKSYVDFI